MKKTLITSALPYANGLIHFGHLAGNNLPADIYARFCRLRGDDVLFVCGSDEYGMAVSLSAQLAGRTPQEHVDYFHRMNQALFERMDMSWDHYSRTSWSGHGVPVQQFFLDLIKNGYIEERWSEQLYSSQESRFLSDRYVVGSCPKCNYNQARGDECPKCAASYEAIDLHQPRSKLTGAPLEKRSTKHWFLRLDLFKQPLLQWLETKPWKANVMNFIKSYIEDLRPRAITRDSNWGIPVPLEGAEGKVLYVWFDAPIGYITASMEWAQLQLDSERWKQYWMDESTQLVQFMGKDNITFHAVIFPSMVMGQDLPLKLVDEMPANEFYNLEGRKFSKSDGWSIDLGDFLDRYDSESLRYMLAATAPETADSEFTWKEYQVRVNGELVGKWGNFIHRVLTFVQKMGGKIPPLHQIDESETLFLAQIENKTAEIEASYGEFKVRRATQLIMELAQICNIYFDCQKPWALLKAGQTEQLESVIHVCLRAIQHLAVATSPILPSKTNQVWNWLAMNSSIAELGWKGALVSPLSVSCSLVAPHVLFAKIEDDQVEREQKFLVEASKIHETATNSQESFVEKPCELQDFLAADIRCALILEAKPVPKSKKLLQILIDVGLERPRQVVSGIAEQYKPEELIGKKVLCLVNLPRAKLMGIDSEGMLLAASSGSLLELPQLQACAPGSRIR